MCYSYMDIGYDIELRSEIIVGKFRPSFRCKITAIILLSKDYVRLKRGVGGGETDRQTDRQRQKDRQRQRDKRRQNSELYYTRIKI